ncbi:hypothetical protein MIMGU_mgv1a017769mg [Erythranthe guttata]|uniref:Uncharacterized protein n=1 Tax=Erythranthe guttata TaxID=4155 RepID=A0A022QHH0_ERYGU|nr:hypothetical protein MIMGU_mgv1a017769mg [Erythranthe guttata]
MGDPNWIIAIKDKIENMPDFSQEIEQWKKRSIYKLPPRVIDLDSKSYKPQIVSIGPYHHGEPHLKPMEDHKERALVHFIKRSSVPIEAYLEALNHVVQDLRDAYDALDPKWLNNAPDFLRLMILDGCFILEVLRMGSSGLDAGYAPNDPVFSSHGLLYVLPFLRCDMLLLENQVPLLVLVKLLQVEKKKFQVEPHDEYQMNRLIIRFFHPGPRNMRVGKCLHILDVCRKSLLNEPRTMRTHHAHGHQGGEVSGEIHSASELSEAGIRFERSIIMSLRDISFEGNTLRLPMLFINAETKLELLNLIAFERFHTGAGNEVSSDPKDVSLLRSCGIIYNALGSDKDIIKLFKLLHTDIVVDPDSDLDIVYMQVSRKLSRRLRKRLHEWGSDFARTYFRSPWAVVSIIAGVLLFTLAAIQTVYSVLGYYRPK